MNLFVSLIMWCTCLCALDAWGETEGPYPEVPLWGGESGGNNILSRQRRTVALAKGVALAIKWSISFPIKSVTNLKSSLQITHTVVLPLIKVYPEKGEKDRIDFSPGDYLDQELLSELLAMSKGVANRMGQPFSQYQNNPNFEHITESLLKNPNIVNSLNRISESNWTRGNEIHDNLKSSILSLTKKIFKETKFNETLKKDRLRSRQDRLYFYKDFESLLQKMGLPSRSCLLRTICEISQHPFDDSLFGELLNILMTASLGGRPEFPEEEDEYNTYIDAELFGRRNGECGQRYKECSNSLFSLLYDIFEDIFS